MELKPHMRIVIPTMGGGGSERVCLRLANHWAESGLEVEILLVRRSGPNLMLLDPRVRVRSAEASRILFGLPWLLREANRRPEVPLLVFGFDLGVGLGALKRLGLLAPHIIYREGSDPYHNVPKHAHWRYRLFVGAADAVIAQSVHALRCLRQLGVRPARSAVIWNPLPGSEPIGERRAPQLRDKFRLVVVGRLSPEKGYLRLLDAVGMLRDRIECLTILGDGIQRQELELRISELGLNDQVKLMGYVPDPSSLVAKADLYVLPSIYEGQPNALLEAIRGGCPVVAAGGEGVREILTRLGLPECWLRGEDFALEFARALPCVLAIKPARWEEARRLMNEFTGISLVSDAYRRTAHEIYWSTQCE